MQKISLRQPSRQVPDENNSVEHLIALLASTIKHQIGRSYENKNHKNPSTELSLQFHRTKPGVLGIRVKEELGLVIGLESAGIGEDLLESTCPGIEPDELLVNFNKCASVLRSVVFPQAFSIYESKAAFSSLDVILRFRSGKMSSYTFKLDAVV